MKHIEQLHLDAIEESMDWIDTLNGWVWGIKKEAAAAKSAEITENIACEFAEFISNHRLDFHPSTRRFIRLDIVKPYTAKELFQEYLKTKENV